MDSTGTDRRLGGLGMGALAALAVSGFVLAGRAMLPNDGATATVKRFDSVRAM